MVRLACYTDSILGSLTSVVSLLVTPAGAQSSTINLVIGTGVKHTVTTAYYVLQ